MAVFPHGSARGGSRSDGPQQIKDLRADDFYGDSHDGNDGSRGSHDTTRNTRTYVPPTFAEAADVSEEIPSVAPTWVDPLPCVCLRRC